LDDAIDPTGPAPVVLRELVLLGTPIGPATATSLEKAAITLALDNGGATLKATLQRPAATAPNNLTGPGIYRSVVTLTAGTGIVAIANIEVVLG
jgi:hypothetical protein